MKPEGRTKDSSRLSKIGIQSMDSVDRPFVDPSLLIDSKTDKRKMNDSLLNNLSKVTESKIKIGKIDLTKKRKNRNAYQSSLVSSERKKREDKSIS